MGNRKIKIAQVITRMDKGGAPDIVRLLCRSLDAEKYDVRLIYGSTAYPSQETESFLKEFKDNIISVPYLKRNIRPLSDILAVIRLYLLFRREKFNVVHAHTAKGGALGRLAAKMANVSLILYSPHGHDFYGYFNPFVSRMVITAERFLAHFTDRIITLTQLGKKDFIDFKIASPKKIVVISSGLVLERYNKIEVDIAGKRQELGITEDKVLVGMVGRLETVKGPEYFIKAASIIVDEFPDVAFLVVGEGRLKYKLESMAKESGISEKVFFAGWREDVPEILPLLDILVLPSLNEAVGRILIEAGASGIPVVATNVGGIPEIVRDNQTGILVSARDAYGLAQAVISLLRDKQKRQSLAEAAKNWIDDKFSVYKMVEEISNLYSELMKNEKT